jgi:hypothetical protein
MVAMKKHTVNLKHSPLTSAELRKTRGYLKAVIASRKRTHYLLSCFKLAPIFILSYFIHYLNQVYHSFEKTENLDSVLLMSGLLLFLSLIPIQCIFINARLQRLAERQLYELQPFEASVVGVMYSTLLERCEKSELTRKYLQRVDESDRVLLIIEAKLLLEATR